MYYWNPELYVSSSSAQTNQGLELLTKVFLKGNERILDIGCGDERLSAEIARNLPEGSILGIDVSEAMVNFAKAHYPPEQFPNLALCRQAGELPFDSEYDIIFSNSALHLIKGSEPVLKGFSRSLRTEGTLLAQF